MEKNNVNNNVNNSNTDNILHFLEDLFVAAENSEDLTKRQVKSIKALKVELFTQDNIIFQVINNEDKLLLEKVDKIFFEKEIKNILNREISVFFKEKKEDFLDENHNKEIHKLAENYIINKDDEVQVEENKTGLREEMTFDNFIAAPSNSIVYASSVEISENPGDDTLNMLYIYGSPGLGKTHLLNAIGNNTVKIYPEKKVRCFTSENFVTDYVEAVAKRGSKMKEFDEKYRNLDVLLIDDMQFFTVDQKESTQTFFHIINKMISEKKQIVFTADVEPKKLKGLHERLISRINGGLFWEIKKPDFELREAYIKKHIENKNLPNELSFTEKNIRRIAAIMKTNIRELQGAIDKIVFYCEINNEKVSDNIIDFLLKSEINRSDNEINIKKITDVVLKYFNISEEEIRGKSRIVKHVKARDIAIYLSRKLTNMTTIQIGSYFHRDHSAAIYSDKKIKNILTKNKEKYKEIDEITKIIQEG